MNLRRSLLMTPGHDGRLAAKAAASEADMVWLELKDGVELAEKPRAREQIVRSFTELDWHGKTRAVRLNALDSGMAEDDLRAVVVARPEAIVLSKTRGPEDVIAIARLLDSLGQDAADIRIWAMVETPLAVVRIEEIAIAHPRMQALILGAGGLFADTRRDQRRPGNVVRRDVRLRDGTRVDAHARSRVVFTARAFGLVPIEGSTGIGRRPGVRRGRRLLSALYSFRMGFEGKLCG